MRLKGKVAIVTAGAQGIGGASSRLFGAEGAKVTVVDISPKHGEDTLRAIESAGGVAQFVQADIGTEAGVNKMVDATISKWGRVDILFNNAGISVVKFIDETTEEEWDRLFDVNLKSIFRASKLVIPYMKKQGGGVILSTGSIASILGQVRTPAYNASKGAVLLLTKCMAADYGIYNIRVNCLCPGITDTPSLRRHIDTAADPEEMIRERTARVPLGRFLAPEELAKAALYLVSDDSEGVTGIGHLVDAGLLSVPEYSSNWFPKQAK